MGNVIYKMLTKQSAIIKYTKFAILMSFFLGSFWTFAAAQNPGANGATRALCQVFGSVVNIVFLLGLTLMILGAVLYAGGNIMPSQSRGPFQGYGMAMIIGGIVGVAIAIAAPFVLNLIVQSGTGTTGFFGVQPAPGAVQQNVVTVCQNAGAPIPGG